MAMVRGLTVLVGLGAVFAGTWSILLGIDMRVG
jgi:hypothetical protein